MWFSCCIHLRFKYIFVNVLWNKLLLHRTLSNIYLIIVDEYIIYAAQKLIIKVNLIGKSNENLCSLNFCKFINTIGKSSSNQMAKSYFDQYQKNNSNENTPVEKTKMAEKKIIDSLNGLRGLLSLHIVLHHFFYYTRFNLNLMGAVSTVEITLINSKTSYEGSKRVFPTYHMRPSVYVLQNTVLHRFVRPRTIKLTSFVVYYLAALLNASSTFQFGCLLRETSVMI